jgi:multiple sugar transport system substrate-binding protein
MRSASRATARSPTPPGTSSLGWKATDAQIDVVAKSGNVLSRPDLANNKYSAKDPRLVLFNSVAKNGQTPFAKNFGATFNDPRGPWLVLLRDAVFGDASKIDADNKAIDSSLNP